MSLFSWKEPGLSNRSIRSSHASSIRSGIAPGGRRQKMRSWRNSLRRRGSTGILSPKSWAPIERRGCALLDRRSWRALVDRIESMWRLRISMFYCTIIFKIGVLWCVYRVGNVEIYRSRNFQFILVVFDEFCSIFEGIKIKWPYFWIETHFWSRFEPILIVKTSSWADFDQKMPFWAFWKKYGAFKWRSLIFWVLTIFRSWAPHEDEKLINLVNSFKVGTEIPWQKIAAYIPGRTKHSCEMRFTRSLDRNLKMGRWSEEEDLVREFLALYPSPLAPS